jgi:YfiH family protein
MGDKSSPIRNLDENKVSSQPSSTGVQQLTVMGWEEIDWLWHGFSTRAGGVSRVYLPDVESDAGELNLGFTAADPAENVRENRLRFVAAVTGSRLTPLVAVRQVHSNRSVVLRAPFVGFGPEAIPEADGLISDQPGLLLAIQTADCVPVLVVDRMRRVVAGFHAGWRGTVEQIVELGVETMRAEFGSEPGDLAAAIGPGIGSCCYTVGDEVLDRFTKNFSYAPELFSQRAVRPDESVDGSNVSVGLRVDLRVDLIEANRRQLLAAGLNADSISVAGGCTGCHPELFYSHRTSGGHAGRMMSVIGIR